MAHELEEAKVYTSTQPIGFKVTLSSGDEEEEEDDSEPSEPVVVAPFYPLKKIPNWWLVVGDPKTRQLIGIRKVTIPKKTLTVQLQLSLPAGTHRPHLYVICDSYMGADQDLELDEITVVQGEDSDEEESEEDDDGDEEMKDA